jgi:putative restriction endonuclease
MANAVFTTKVTPDYDDLPEIRYHFPRTYLKQAEAAVGDWIVYYEPRREDAHPAGHAGRQCYFATARVTRIVPDQQTDGHFYAYMSDYLEFTEPVAFKTRSQYPESALKKADGSTNKRAFGRAVRVLPRLEFQTILQMGLSSVFSSDKPALQPAAVIHEPDPEYSVDRRRVILERPLRDIAFARAIRSAYQSTCAMTGLKLINGGGRCEIEAAHIKPVEKLGPDSVRNGIALSRTVHWMFDRGIISLDDDGRILKAAQLVPPPVARLLNPDGFAALPQASAARPHPLFLRYHRETVFKSD